MNKQQFFLTIYKNFKKKFSNHGYGNYPIIKELNQFLINQAKSNFAQVDGNKMYLDPNDSLGLSVVPIYDYIETEFVKKQVKNGDIVFDIGANIGYFTLIFAKLVGNKGKVYAFEAEPQNFELLKKNVEINGYQNVILENVAVSKKNGKTELFLSEKNSGMHRIYSSHFCSDKSIQVNMIKLDDYLNNIKFNDKISFIKMDVEGSEFGVLEGMEKTLKENEKLTIILEFVPSCIKEYGAQPKDLLNFLRNYGFIFSFINEESQKIEPIEDTKDFLKKYDGKIIEKKPKRTNLICTKK